IQREVDTVTGRISFLRAELEGLEDRLRRHRAALSPVRRVPLEILAEIFSNLFTDDLDFHSDDRDVVLQLGQVCRSWRQATLASHRLWAKVSVVYQE
ncbi:hypothetical protein DFP72DRAFT_796167, partial [Ephemerocybe angulata]